MAKPVHIDFTDDERDFVTTVLKVTEEAAKDDDPKAADEVESMKEAISDGRPLTLFDWTTVTAIASEHQSLNMPDVDYDVNDVAESAVQKMYQEIEK